MTQEKNKHQCEAMVSGDFHEYQCSRAGVVFEDGKWYCRQHAPSAVAEREAARQAERKAIYERAQMTYRIGDLEHEIALSAGPIVRRLIHAFRTCPVCGFTDGHGDDCQVAALLRAAEELEAIDQ